MSEHEKCKVCGSTFWSKVTEDAHKKLYPAHFKKDAAPEKPREDEAVLTSKKTKRKAKTDE